MLVHKLALLLYNSLLGFASKDPKDPIVNDGDGGRLSRLSEWIGKGRLGLLQMTQMRKLHQILERLNELTNAEKPLLFHDFTDVADSFVDGYARLAQQGMPSHTVGLAMLGATVNIYNLLGVEHALPELLHALADEFEQNNPPI